MATESIDNGRSDPHGLWNTERPRMHVGTQRFDTTDEHLSFLARHGVNSMGRERHHVPPRSGLGCRGTCGET